MARAATRLRKTGSGSQDGRGRRCRRAGMNARASVAAEARARPIAGWSRGVMAPSAGPGWERAERCGPTGAALVRPGTVRDRAMPRSRGCLSRGGWPPARRASGSSGRGPTGSAARRASPATGGHGTADRRVVPGEAELVAAVELVRHEVDELERLEGEEAVGDPGRDDDPVVGRQLARLDDRRRRDPPSTRPDVDEGDERPARRDDPVVELAAVVVEAAQDAGGRASTGWPGRTAARCPPARRSRPA